MTTNHMTGQKRVVEQLNFGAKTIQRVTWESWSFRIVGPHQVEVRNESYGYLAEDHSYVVGVEERGGLAVPAECDCKSDRFREEYDCKHKVALATIGGPTVLNAAIEYESPRTGEPIEPETMADRVRADGGVAVHADTSATESDDCDCVHLSGFPCWPCVRDGNRELPE